MNSRVATDLSQRIFQSFEAGNCDSNSSFKWMKKYREETMIIQPRVGKSKVTLCNITVLDKKKSKI